MFSSSRKPPARATASSRGGGLAKSGGPPSPLVLPDPHGEKERRAAEEEARRRWEQHIIEHGHDPVAAKLMRADPKLQRERAAEYDEAMKRGAAHEADRQARIARRRAVGDTIAAETARHKSIPFHGGDKSLDGWHGGDERIIGSHHKFPKRTLKWLHDRMTPKQREDMNARLELPKGAGAKAWARHRSLLIPWGADKVDSAIRSDDPEHTGEGVDVVRDESGRMTPRSREYSSLADHYDEIRQRLETLGGDRQHLTDEEAAGVSERFRRAELAHYGIEKDPRLPADYGPGFWRRDPRNAARPFSKSAVPSGRYDAPPASEAEWRRAKAQERDEAEQARLQEMEQLRVSDKWMGKSERIGQRTMEAGLPARPGGFSWTVRQGRNQAETDYLGAVHRLSGGRMTEEDVDAARSHPSANEAQAAYRRMRDPMERTGIWDPELDERYRRELDALAARHLSDRGKGADHGPKDDAADE